MYRDKIFYFRQHGGYDEKELFKIEPDVVVNTHPSLPLDVPIQPRFFILGNESSGKSTIATDLASSLNIVHLKMNDSEVVDQFINMDCALGNEL